MVNDQRKLTGIFSRWNTFFNENRESGETLLGTMIGVLLLSIMTSAFAGIFLAASASTTGARESSSRISLINSYNSDALTDLRVEKKVAPSGWTANAPTTGWDYASSISVGTSGSVQVNQWGVTTGGIVSIYTAIPKPRSTVACNSTTTENTLQASCLVVFGSATAVLNPSVSSDWRNKVAIQPWVAADLTTSRTVTYPQGAMNNATITPVATGSTRTLDFVFKATSSVAQNITFSYDSSPNTFVTVPINASTQYYYGTLTVPIATTNVTVSDDSGVTVSNFVIYAG